MKVDFFHRQNPASKSRLASDSELQLFIPRLNFLLVVFFLLLGCLLARLAYWQIVKGEELRAIAANQYQRKITYEGQRGNIFTSDNFLLVSNEPVFHVFGQPHLLESSPEQVARQLLSHLTPYITEDWQNASQSGTLTQKLSEVETQINTQLNKTNSKWVPLFRNIRQSDMTILKNLKIKGLTFEASSQRLYPEASMAAQVLGFVGQDAEGEEIGYFGVEGALNKELKSQIEQRTIEADAIGGRLGPSEVVADPHGRDIVLTIRRDIQYLAETSLKTGMEKYGAAEGEVIIMEPKTGKILAMASFPNYDPGHFSRFENTTYKNPSVSDLYEPGSTFKILTVAAGIDAGAISENTQCPRCATARRIASYTLKTWNDQYNPNITMNEALAKSDNTAMIYITEELGADRFQNYLKRFGIGAPSQVELQEDSAAQFPEKWGPVELATRSFGQGISTTSLQLLKAVNAIANHGKLMKPLIVEKVISPNTKEAIVTQPQVEAQVVSPQTAATVSEMMINSALHGEAQWTASRTHEVAGKTGTAQIAVNGSYDATKTVASFIGFAPAHDPQFIMLVKLTEPTSSPWAAETAAPLWYQIANKLYLLLKIPPDFSPETKVSPPPISAAHAVTLD